VVRNVVYLVYWPVTNREKQQYGFTVMQEHGLNVQVCDLTNLCNEEAIKKNPVQNELKEGYILKINTFAELEAYFAKTAANSIFIDYMRGLAELDAKTHKVFYYLNKYRIRYCTVITAALPTPEIELKANNRLGLFVRRLKNILHPARLQDCLIRKAIAQLRRLGLFYALPVKIFSTDTPQLDQFLAKYRLAKSVKVKMHNPDYYEFARYLEAKQSFSLIAEPFCALIDEGMVAHPDWDICDVQKLDPKLYMAEMHKIIDYVEAEFKLKVVVAAHPRSNIEVLKDLYPGKTIIQGKTLQLIADSELVLAHLSTVVGFAALVKKPMIMIETSEMKKIYYYHMTIHAMASALGLKPFETDTEEFAKLHEYGKCSLVKYDQYLARYVKTEGAADGNMWDIIYQEVVKLG
jgi:hypothetical protein